MHLWHGILNRIPVVNSIYSSVKQISDTLFSSSGQAFRRALLVQWPHEGMWTIAFLTGTPGGDVLKHLQGDYVSVYVPTTPNPPALFVMVERKGRERARHDGGRGDKYIISMGVFGRPARLVAAPCAPTIAPNLRRVIGKRVTLAAGRTAGATTEGDLHRRDDRGWLAQGCATGPGRVQVADACAACSCCAHAWCVRVPPAPPTRPRVGEIG